MMQQLAKSRRKPMGKSMMKSMGKDTIVEKRRGTRWLIGMLLVVLCLFLWPEQTKVYASVRDNASDFYHTYGNEAVFLANSQTDGVIYCATKGVIASSGLRYQTIGWRMTVTGNSSSQTIYYALDGSYISKLSTTTEGPYEYNLYGVSLGTVKNRMNASSLAALNSGNCRIILDACMVTKSGASLSGSMNDYGGFSGTVYMDYEGIANAAAWTAASKEELHSYFNKSVQGLICNLSVSGDGGIASVSGGGNYCYGSYVYISAVPRKGYLFSYWVGGGDSASYGLYVDGNKSLYAVSRPKETRVKYWRNMDESDGENRTITYVYDRANQHFGDGIAWKWIGHHVEGFGATKDAVSYALGQGVTNDWILDHYPKAELYTIWDINHYKVVYDGNGATAGSMEAEDYIYTDTMHFPENGFEKTDCPCTFVGYSLSKDSLREEYKVGEEVELKDLAERTGLEYQNGTITLYAIWDYAPEIRTGDLYYSYQEGLDGSITPEEIGRFVRCPDREDGVLPLSMEEEMGMDEEGLTVGYWYIRDYDSGEIEELVEHAKEQGLDETELALTIVARDHAGNVTEEEIILHFVDTTVRLGMDCYGRVRFINKTYLYAGNEGENESEELRAEEDGGLKEHSVWRLNEEYRSLLMQVVGAD